MLVARLSSRSRMNGVDGADNGELFKDRSISKYLSALLKRLVARHDFGLELACSCEREPPETCRVEVEERKILVLAS